MITSTDLFDSLRQLHQSSWYKLLSSPRVRAVTLPELCGEGVTDLYPSLTHTVTRPQGLLNLTEWPLPQVLPSQGLLNGTAQSSTW